MLQCGHRPVRASDLERTALGDLARECDRVYLRYRVDEVLSRFCLAFRGRNGIDRVAVLVFRWLWGCRIELGCP